MLQMGVMVVMKEFSRRSYEVNIHGKVHFLSEKSVCATEGFCAGTEVVETAKGVRCVLNVNTYYLGGLAVRP